MRLILGIIIGLVYGFIAGAPLGYRNAQAAAPEPAALAAALPAPTATLRGSAVVQDNVIRLGDLFDNVGEKANISVAYAPTPGRRAVFDAQWLSHVARSHRIRWRALSRYDRATIERASQIVSASEIERELRNALAEATGDGPIEVSVSGRLQDIHISTAADPTVVIEDMHYDAPSGRFSAQIAVSPATSEVSRVRVAGRVYELVEVPVPARRLASGERIRADDLELTYKRSDQIKRGALTDMADLVGKASTRTLQAGRPIQGHNIREPLLVSRKGMVTMLVKAPGMTITARGVALDDGARGDTIRIRNLRSERIVEGVVVGPDTVHIEPRQRIADASQPSQRGSNR